MAVVELPTEVDEGTWNRFWCKVDKSGECWAWTASGTGTGYGHFGLSETKTVLAHRLAYTLLVGPIPEGMQIDHLCRNRACVNPSHMEAVTGQVNTLRGESPSAMCARKTRCRNGHPYAGDNLRIDKDGARRCRKCDSAASARAYRKRKARNS